MKGNYTPEPKPKEAKFHVLSLDEDGSVFEVLAAERLNHPELTQAQIGLCWILGINSDVDGKLVLGKAIKAPPLWQQVSGIDWFVGINRRWWQDADDKQKAFLIDHELCHMAQKIDKKTGGQVIDDHGFLQWRTVKHDLEEFLGPVQRHGIRFGDLHRFIKVANDAQQRFPFVASGADATPEGREFMTALNNLIPKKGSGIDSVTVSHDGNSVTLGSDVKEPAEPFLVSALSIRIFQAAADGGLTWTELLEHFAGESEDDFNAAMTHCLGSSIVDCVPGEDGEPDRYVPHGWNLDDLHGDDLRMVYERETGEGSGRKGDPRLREEIKAVRAARAQEPTGDAVEASEWEEPVESNLVSGDGASNLPPSGRLSVLRDDNEGVGE